MRVSTVLQSVFNLLFASFLILGGLSLLLIPILNGFRRALIKLLTASPYWIGVVGAIVFLVGVLLLVSHLTMNRRRYYQLRMGDRPVTVDNAVVEVYLQQYWENMFTGQEVSSQVTIHKDRIEVSADLPAVPFSEQKALLERIEQELVELFEKVLGYRREFLLSVSFQESA